MTEIKCSAPVLPKNNEFPLAYHHLFQHLREQKITWCSWKSNEHLLAGLKGETDIDVLFYEADRQRVLKVMHECGFILFKAPSHRSYPNIVDTISIAPQTGNILHAHVHFLVVAGEKYLKGVVLPWNESILGHCIKSEISEHIPVVTPDIEAVLLVAREALKIRQRDIGRVPHDKVWGGKGFQTEFSWLKERATDDEIAACAVTLLNDDAAKIMREMLSSGATFARFLILRDHVRTLAEQRGWRRMSTILACMTMWTHEALYIATRIAEKLKLSQQFIIRRRTLPGAGVIVAFVGADGSGKSTVSKTIIAEWEHKIDITHIYFGTGDGKPTLWRCVLKLTLSAGALLKKPFKKMSQIHAQNNAQTAPLPEPSAPSAPALATVLSACFSTLDKRRQVRRARRLRARGFFVVCDRWPQNEVSGINDGPFLAPYRQHENTIYKAIAQWEDRQFKKIAMEQTPDIIFRLTPSLDVAVNRKEENKSIAGKISRKLAAFETIAFSKLSEQHVIDADQPITDVLMQTREVIWRHLQNRAVDDVYSYECLGAPGAGKTTVCNALYDECDLNSAESLFSPSSPITFVEKMSCAFMSCVSCPTAYIYAVSLIFKLQLWRSADSLRHICKLPMQAFRLRRAAKTDAYLMEQLLLQNLWSALVSSNARDVKPEVLAPFIACLYHDVPTKVLHFKITPEMAALRISGRENGGSRFDGLPKEMVEEELSLFVDLIDDIARAASYAGLQVCDVDASLPVEQVYENAKSWISL